MLMIDKCEVVGKRYKKEMKNVFNMLKNNKKNINAMNIS
jgi:hypothetical protein